MLKLPNYFIYELSSGLLRSHLKGTNKVNLNPVVINVNSFGNSEDEESSEEEEKEYIHNLLYHWGDILNWSLIVFWMKLWLIEVLICMELRKIFSRVIIYMQETLVKEDDSNRLKCIT